MRIALHMIIFVFVLPFHMLAEGSFQVAIKATEKNDYTSAIKIFDSIIQAEPSNLSAIVNSGNCYFELKEYGRAIHRYESALKMSPGDMEVVRSIEACYSALGKQVLYSSPYGTLDTLLFKTGNMTWAVLSIFFVIMLSIALFMKLTAKGKPIFRTYMFMVIMGVMAMTSLYAGMRVHEYLERKDYAIITARTAPLLQNEQGELSGFHLTQGSRVKVLSRSKGMLSITDENGQHYFVRESDLLCF